MSVAGKHVAILGAGRSGRAAAALALREGARVSLWDSGEIANNLSEGVECHANVDASAGEGVAADLVVTSPGIDTYGPFVKAFAKGAGELIGETEFASRLFNGRIVGITGTNGKTTCTELVARILEAAGMGGDPCGNHGRPFSEILMQPEVPAAVALELSSFQLETIHSLRPDVAIWLNFAPDHMDRYPDIDAYRTAKLRVFENQTADDLAVLRDGEDIPPLAPQVVRFSTENPDCEWYSDGARIVHGGETVCDMQADTCLRGRHNAENLMAAMAACADFGISTDMMCEALSGYAPPPHRCELIRTLDGVEYLNDSKATNLHALESALRSQTRPVVLIAGGKQKGLDYEPLLPLLREKALSAVTFGEIGSQLLEMFKKAVPTVQVTTLDEAVTAAKMAAPHGSSVLLSPGTSSFDQFKSYIHRGDCFRELVQNLH